MQYVVTDRRPRDPDETLVHLELGRRKGGADASLLAFFRLQRRQRPVQTHGQSDRDGQAVQRGVRVRVRVRVRMRVRVRVRMRMSVMRVVRVDGHAGRKAESR